MVAQLVKNLPTMQETWVISLGWEDPLEKRISSPVFLPGEFHKFNGERPSKRQERRRQRREKPGEDRGGDRSTMRATSCHQKPPPPEAPPRAFGRSTVLPRLMGRKIRPYFWMRQGVYSRNHGTRSISTAVFGKDNLPHHHNNTADRGE